MTAANNTVLVDGMMVNGLQADGAVQSYFNDAMNQEVSYQTAGIGADTSAGGVRLNMIPREGGNRFSGDFKMAYRPGAWQSDNLTERHIDRGLKPATPPTASSTTPSRRAVPIMKDKLWFFGSARYFSVNNFIANTFFDDGSQGVDDQFIKSAMARLTWQISPQQRSSPATSTKSTSTAATTCRRCRSRRRASWQWFSPAYHTTRREVDARRSTSRLLLEGGFSSNLEYYTNSYQDGVEEPRGTPALVRQGVAQTSWTSAAARRAPTSRPTESPARYAVARRGVVRHRARTTSRSGAQMTWGTFMHTRDANADLVQQVPQQRAPAFRSRARQRDHPQHAARLRRAAELRHRHLRAGLVDAEPADGQRRPPLREAEGAGAGRGVAGRPLRAGAELRGHREPAELERLRAALRGGLRPVRQRARRRSSTRSTATTWRARPASRPTTTRCWRRPRRCTWRDVNGDDIAQGERGCTRLPERRLRDQLRDAVVELRHRGAQRVRRLPAHLEPRARPRSCSTSCSRACRCPAAGSTAPSTT